MSGSLRVYAPPFTPSGQAWVAPPLPYHCAHNVLQVLFEAEPTALRDLLPPPFEPYDEREGRAMIAVLDAVMTWGDESDDLPPAYHQATESFVVVPCRYRGEPGKFFVVTYADRDWLHAASSYLGMVGQIAQIQLTRLHPLHRTLSAPRPGLRLSGQVEVSGRHVLSAAVSLEREVSARQLPFSSAEWANFGLRVYPGLRDVVTVVTEDRQIGPVWEGEATLELEPDGPLAGLGPVQPLRGHWTTYAYTMAGVRRLGDG